jgi:hypothetical protein
MSNKQIQISKGTHSFVASPGSVQLAAGDAVTFVSAGADDAVLCFSSNAPDFLTPAPTLPPDPGVALPAGASVTFTVSGDPQGCSVQVLSLGSSGTPDATGLPPGLLAVLTPSHRPGPTDPGQNGGR